MKRNIFIAVLIAGFVLTPFFVAGEEKSREVTTFRIKVAADQYYRTKRQEWQKYFFKNVQEDNKDEWKQDLINLINFTNEKLKAQDIEVKFEIGEIVVWQTEEKEVFLKETLHDLIDKVPKHQGYDLVIGITAKAFPKIEENGGYYIAYNYIIIRDLRSFVLEDDKVARDYKDSSALLLLLHELGHFLGLNDSENPESIMCKNWVYKQDKFLIGEIEFINQNAPKMKFLSKF